MGHRAIQNCGRILTALAAAAFPSLAAMDVSAAEAIDNATCLMCHEFKDLTRTNAAGLIIPLYVDAARLAASVHKKQTCSACHADLTSEHPDDGVPAKTVQCLQCHAPEGATYGASVHGAAINAGRSGAATCRDCHGSHDVFPPTSPDSLLHFSRQTQTCGQCHVTEAEDLAQSVHGKASAAGVREAPTCTDCHSEHRIQPLNRGSLQEISKAACSTCHASERLNTKFKLPKDRVKTFFESYHGLAVQYGSTVAANCGSCHGYHKVLPSSDPDSTIHQSHLVETCAKCHPGANEKFALGKVHVAITGARPRAKHGAGWCLPAWRKRRIGFRRT